MTHTYKNCHCFFHDYTSVFLYRDFPIGGTGSGKSSLVQLIPRLYDATVGTVSVGGKDIRTYDLEALLSYWMQKSGSFTSGLLLGCRVGTAREQE